MHMIQLNHYVRGTKSVTTADLVRECASDLQKLADSMDQPNEAFALFNKMFDVVTRDRVADKLADFADKLHVVATDLRGDVVDQRTK
jgi:hypothetical protein